MSKPSVEPELLFQTLIEKVSKPQKVALLLNKKKVTTFLSHYDKIRAIGEMVVDSAQVAPLAHQYIIKRSLNLADLPGESIDWMKDQLDKKAAKPAEPEEAEEEEEGLEADEKTTQTDDLLAFAILGSAGQPADDWLTEIVQAYDLLEAITMKDMDGFVKVAKAQGLNTSEAKAVFQGLKPPNEPDSLSAWRDLFKAHQAFSSNKVYEKMVSGLALAEPYRRALARRLSSQKK